MLAIRYIAPNGGAVLYLNGFILVGADEAGRFNIPIAHFLKEGPNVFEVSSAVPGSVELSVVQINEDDPEAAPVLLRPEGRVPFAPQSFWRGELELGAGGPAFAWHEAEQIDDVDRWRDTLHGFLREVQGWLQNGPNDSLMQVLRVKHDEIATAMGLAPTEMDQGLADGLAAKRLNPGFRVDLVSGDQFDPVLSSNRRVVNMRRRDGSDALRVIDGEADAGFAVAFVRHQGRWIVAR